MNKASITALAAIVLVVPGIWLVLPESDANGESVELSGKVQRGDNGDVLADAALLWTAPGKNPIAAHADYDGQFSMMVPAVPDCQLEARAAGLAPSLQSLSCSTDKYVEFTLTPPGDLMTGHVLDAMGNGIADVELVLAWDENSELSSSAADGSFTLPVPREDAILSVNHIDFASRVIPVAAGTTSVEVVLTQAVTASQGREWRFTTHDTGGRFGEPIVDFLPSGDIVVQAGLITLKSHDGEKWEAISPPADDGLVTGLGSQWFLAARDPALHVDRDTGRLFVFQSSDGSCGRLAWTDDEGAAWTTNPYPCPTSRPDRHDRPALATGPAADPEPDATRVEDYANVLYLCGFGVCGRSHDGGHSWPPIDSSPDRGGECDEIPAGEAIVLPTGTLMLAVTHCPDGGTNGEVQGVAVSRNNGRTYQEIIFADDPPRTTGSPIPWMHATRDGAAYFVTVAGDNLPRLRYSDDDGRTWSDARVLQPRGVTSTAFPVVAASTGGQVAVAFLGTKDSTAPQSYVDPETRWHLWLAYSDDIQNGTAPIDYHQITPKLDPVQIGRICMFGTRCPEYYTDGEAHRNLLDFITMEYDADGRLAIAYADGCRHCASEDESTRNDVFVAIQREGPTMRAS